MIDFDIFSSRGREQMSLPRLWSQELDPFRMMRREMENALRAFDQKPSPGIGAGVPAISVAETNDAFEVTAELPGVDEKDINVSLEDNQLVISGEKKAESTKERLAHRGAELRLILSIDVFAFRAGRGSRRSSFRQGRTPSLDQEACQGPEERQDNPRQDGPCGKPDPCIEQGRCTE